MSALRELQETFQSHLLTDNPAISNFITGASPEMVQERLAIYNNGYYSCLLETLDAYYSLLEKLMGEDDFLAMGEAYIQSYPSHYFSIDLFGQHLAEFLAKTKPYSEKLYLSELADFIWKLNSTIDAADAPTLTMEQVTAIPQENWPQICIKLHPSATLVKTQWNILPIWQALLQNQEVPTLEQKSSHILVWRKDMQPYYTTVTPEEAEVFKALKNQQNFGEICENLVEYVAEDQVASFVVNLLIRWLNNNMLSEVGDLS